MCVSRDSRFEDSGNLCWQQISRALPINQWPWTGKDRSKGNLSAWVVRR